jgi:hypothetical protein
MRDIPIGQDCRKKFLPRGAVLILLVSYRQIPVLLVDSLLSSSMPRRPAAGLQSRLWEIRETGNGVSHMANRAPSSSNRMNSNMRVREILKVLVAHENRSSQQPATDKLCPAWSRTKNYVYNRQDLQAEEVNKVLKFLDDGR